jgi:hypothetical protein
VEVVLRSGQHGVDVRVAARAEQVVHAAAVLVVAVPGEAVGDDCDEGPHVGEVGPEAVVGGYVSGVKLPGAGGPEAFAGVVAVPDVEIAFYIVLAVYMTPFIECLYELCRRKKQWQQHGTTYQPAVPQVCLSQ